MKELSWIQRSSEQIELLDSNQFAIGVILKDPSGNWNAYINGVKPLVTGTIEECKNKILEYYS